MEKTLLLHALEWYKNNGITIPLQDRPHNHFIPESLPMKTSSPSKTSIKPTVSLAHPALQCNTLIELKQAMQDYEDCDLKQSAMNLVFADGNPEADLMLVGEAPGADEDRQGLPFVGQSGQLLDKILKAINLDRTKVYISNIIPWRPPGNRPPTTQEIALCQPFIQKHIELIRPKILVFLGGVAAKTLLNSTEGIMKLRGNLKDYAVNETLNVKAMATFHPAYLLRSPGQKSLVWRDFLIIEQALKTL